MDTRGTEAVPVLGTAAGGDVRTESTIECTKSEVGEEALADGGLDDDDDTGTGLAAASAPGCADKVGFMLA